jgi:RNA polymerase sigma factor (sigma-70 family)
VKGPVNSLRARAEPSGNAQTVREWFESPYLARLAARVAAQYGVPPADIPDLLQELRLALWRAGPDLMVNVTWILHTANHKAIDLLRRRRRAAEESCTSVGIPSSRSSGDPSLLHLLRARAALLPGDLRDFYLLRYEEGLSQREIANRLGLCRGSVRCLDRRCFRMMKGRLVV